MAKKKQFNPKSEYVRYDKKSKLWIEVRKRNYLYWYKYVQICLQEEYPIDKRKYKGWDLDTIPGRKFDDWWKEHWKDLFGFEREQKTLKKLNDPKFPIATSKIKTNYIRLSILVHMNRNYGNNFEISEKIHLEETLKRYPTLFHYPAQQGFYNRTYIIEVISRLKKRSKELIKKVGNGQFP